MDDDLMVEDIRARKEKRNRELEQIQMSGGMIANQKENGDSATKTSVLRHTFVATKELWQQRINESGGSSATKSPMHRRIPVKAKDTDSAKRNHFLRTSYNEVFTSSPEKELESVGFRSETPNSDFTTSTEEKEDVPAMMEEKEGLIAVPLAEKMAVEESKNENFRPITPYNEIMGSLMDEIKSGYQEYVEKKKCQQNSDPNLSPRSRYASGSESFHTISGYRSHGTSTKRAVAPAPPPTTGTSTSTFDSSLDALPEKRQRSDSEPPSRADSAIINFGSLAGKDVTDSVNRHQQQQFDSSADLKAYIERLHEQIIVQQEQISQASRALIFCRQNDRFSGGQEEINARRALLISTECRVALLKARDDAISGRYPSVGPKGTLTFSQISIRLSRDYIHSYGQNPAEINHYYFIVLIKCSGQFFHTSLVSTDKVAANGCIEYKHFIPIEGILPDFVCELEVFSMKFSEKARDGTADRSGGSRKKGTWRRLVVSTPLNAYTNTFSGYSTGARGMHRPADVIDSGFQRIGRVAITRQLIGRQNFLLNDTAYPLDGRCHLLMDCHQDPDATGQQLEHRSFLSFYQIVSGLGSWTRFWCALLASGELNFWRYPEDENAKDPIVILRLCECITPVTVVPPSMASFPNSMQVEVMPQGDEGEPVRLLFAADTPEARDLWMELINQSIRNTNVWRKVKQPAKQQNRPESSN